MVRIYAIVYYLNNTKDSHPLILLVFKFKIVGIELAFFRGMKKFLFGILFSSLCIAAPGDWDKLAVKRTGFSSQVNLSHIEKVLSLDSVDSVAFTSRKSSSEPLDLLIQDLQNNSSDFKNLKIMNQDTALNFSFRAKAPSFEFTVRAQAEKSVIACPHPYYSKGYQIQFDFNKSDHLLSKNIDKLVLDLCFLVKKNGSVELWTNIFTQEGNDSTWYQVLIAEQILLEQAQALLKALKNRIEKAAHQTMLEPQTEQAKPPASNSSQNLQLAPSFEQEAQQSIRAD